jgi:hypothetical protein
LVLIELGEIDAPYIRFAVKEADLTLRRDQGEIELALNNLDVSVWQEPTCMMVFDNEIAVELSQLFEYSFMV